MGISSLDLGILGAVATENYLATQKKLKDKVLSRQE